MNPLSAVQILGRIVGNPDELDFLGTCSAFRQQSSVLTAAHCIGKLRKEELATISLGRRGLLVRPVIEIIKHPNADIAVLQLAEDESDVSEPFWDCVGNFHLGEDFVAYGFPEDIFGEDVRKPTPRLFKGSFQRFMQHESFMGYHYLAGELSIGCPAGLSGGPLFRPGAPQMLTGIVVENLESTTLLHSVEEIQKDGVIVRVRNQRVISYGVALMLEPIKPWLDIVVPNERD